jgi:hypothetical protein
VGIGTTSPSEKLEVNGTVKAGAFIGDGSLLTGTSQWLDGTGGIYYNSGNVGIGTTAPVNNLHIHAESGADVIRLTNAVTGTNADGMFMGHSSAGATSFDFWNYENDYIRFATNNTEQVRITAAGKVGIGTAGPNMKMSIESTQSADFTLDVLGDTTSSGKWTGIRLGSAGAGNTKKGGIAYKAIDGWSRGELHFLVDSAADANNVAITDSKMMIDNNGNVGIGTTNPAVKLDVNGNVKVNGCPAVFHINDCCPGGNCSATCTECCQAKGGYCIASMLNGAGSCGVDPNPGGGGATCLCVSGGSTCN